MPLQRTTPLNVNLQHSFGRLTVLPDLRFKQHNTSPNSCLCEVGNGYVNVCVGVIDARVREHSLRSNIIQTYLVFITTVGISNSNSHVTATIFATNAS